MDLGLQGRVALVTGSSAGIGFETARTLLVEGSNVVLCGRDRGRLDEAAARLAADVHVPRPAVVAADLSTAEGPAAAVDATMRRHGRIDILVNNASDASVGAISTLSDDELERFFQAKPLGYLRACLAVVPHMRRAGGGVILNVAGISARSVSPTSRTTLATTSVIGLTKALSEEVAADGIRVVAVSPGPIRTPHLQDNFVAFARAHGKSAREVEAEMQCQIPLGRLGESRDVADAVAFLCSDRAGFITGATLVVDGGKTRAIV